MKQPVKKTRSKVTIGRGQKDGLFGFEFRTLLAYRKDTDQIEGVQRDWGNPADLSYEADAHSRLDKYENEARKYAKEFGLDSWLQIET